MSGPSPTMKKPRQDTNQLKKTHPRNPHLFTPFRTLGVITDGVPIAVRPQTDGHFAIASSVGRAWALYDAAHLRLSFIGKPLRHPIESLNFAADSLLATSHTSVMRYVRADIVDEFHAHEPLGPTLVFGEFLVAVTKKASQLVVWKIAKTSKTFQSFSEHEPYAVIDVPFRATQVLHPATYINKIVVASDQGHLAIVNVATASIIHEFDSISNNSPILCIAQSPALDILALGCASGSTYIMDIKQGDVLLQTQLEFGEAVSCSFRSDNEAQTLAVGSSTGDISLFDLSHAGRLLHVIRRAHEMPVTSVHFLQGQPILVSSSPDNTLQQYAFDSSSPVPRLLRQRSGHHAAPRIVKFYDDYGKGLLTSGGDDRALRYLSVVRDAQSFELSQGSIAKKAASKNVGHPSLKLAPVTCLSFSTTRSLHWDDIVTTHLHEQTAHAWSLNEKRLGKKLGNASAIALCSCVTADGTFSLIGYLDGSINIYNLQSGILRRRIQLFDSDVDTASPSSTITGIATDVLSKTIVASTLDGILHFFLFKSATKIASLPLPSGISRLYLHRNNNLLAAVCDDLVIRLVDIDTRRVVRHLSGSNAEIIDLCFSADSRWLITASQDSVIRVYDIPTSSTIYAFKTPVPPTSVDLSPTGDFLATSHVNSLGVHLWVNRAQLTHVPTISDHSIHTHDLPTVSDLVDADLEAVPHLASWAPSDQDIALWDRPPFDTPDPLARDLTTTSLVSRSHWKALLNWDAIKERNKPTEPVKAPQKAPFFLPPMDSAGRFSFVEEQLNSNQHKLSHNDLENAQSNFQSLLYAQDPLSDYEPFFHYIKKLSPSSLDLEIRSLSLPNDVSTLIHALRRRFDSNRDFDVVLAILAVVLAVHGDEIPLHASLVSVVASFGLALDAKCDDLEATTQYIMTALAFISSTAVV